MRIALELSYDVYAFAAAEARRRCMPAEKLLADVLADVVTARFAGDEFPYDDCGHEGVRLPERVGIADEVRK